MRIPARADYAIRVLLELAADTTRPITCEAVASTPDIPARFIMAVLREAARVRSQRGYWLAKAAEDITVRDAVVAVDPHPPRRRRRAGPVPVRGRVRPGHDPARDDARRPAHRCRHRPTKGHPGMTDLWHQPLRHIRGADLTGDTNQTTGMTRLEAISGKTVGSSKVWMGETHVAPVTNSGDHHHGEAETAIYVKSGHPVFVFADGDEEVRIEAGPGDYIFVPPYVPHREENPTDEEAVVIIARSSQEGIVVNLPSLWSPVDVPED